MRFLAALATVLALVAPSHALTPNQRVLLSGSPEIVIKGAAVDCPLAILISECWVQGNGYQPVTSLLTTARTQTTNSYAATSSGFLNQFFANTNRITDIGDLIETASTNLGFPSEQGALFFNIATNCSIANSATVGPNGSTTFYSTAATTSAGGDRQKNTTITADTGSYRASIYVAAKAGGQTARWAVGIAGGASSTIDFNITTGAISLNTTGTGTVQSVSGGWRVSTTVTNNSNTTLFTQFYPAGGAGSGNADFGGYQLEKQIPLSSYITTVGGSATRNADATSLTSSAFLALPRITITATTPVGTGTQVLWQRDDGSQNNRYTIYRDSSRFIHFVVVSGSTTRSDRAIAVVADNTSFSVSMAWAGTLASYTLNNGVPFLESAVTQPTGLTTERLGKDSSGNQWGGYVARATWFPTANISVPIFYDSFNRANTLPGIMSNPPVGAAYAFYGPFIATYPLPPATNGYIASKAFVEDQNNTSYLEENFGVPPATISNKFYFKASSGSTGDGTLAVLVYNVAGTIDNCIHIQIQQTAAFVQKRVNGVFTTLATLNYTSLPNDGSFQDSSVSISGSTVTVTVNGQSVSATDAFFATVHGNYFIVENAMQDGINSINIVSTQAN